MKCDYDDCDNEGIERMILENDGETIFAFLCEKHFKELDADNNNVFTFSRGTYAISETWCKTETSKG